MSAELHRRYSSPAQVESLRAALAPDNAAFVETSMEGTALHIRVRARNAGELRRTLEDLLACLSAAEKTWDVAQGPRGEEGPAPAASEDEDEG